MLIENISDLMVFTQAVKGGSLSAAGRELGMSLAVASKRLQRLEEQLGVRLLNRSTRQLSLTDEGAEYYHYCVRILAELEEGEERVTRGSKEPKGNLKVTMPAAFGRLHIAPLVPEFLTRYPAIKLTLHLTDSIVDIIDQGYDLAVRIGELKDSSLVAKSIGLDRRVVIATPSYLARYGAPQTPLDLTGHRSLELQGPERGGGQRQGQRQPRYQQLRCLARGDLCRSGAGAASAVGCLAGSARWQAGPTAAGLYSARLSDQCGLPQSPPDAEEDPDIHRAPATAVWPHPLLG